MNYKQSNKKQVTLFSLPYSLSYLHSTLFAVQARWQLFIFTTLSKNLVFSDYKTEMQDH